MAIRPSTSWVQRVDVADLADTPVTVVILSPNCLESF
jgi:hypothetical protein